MGLLPIGSVVTIGEWEQQLMIYGRAQNEVAAGKVWDYVACPYPVGNYSKESNVLFNHQQIEPVAFYFGTTMH
ncbi:DUF4176 domain-containing protein [Ectobacillus panaciterrae]|uniref:DUF4176 domain-containing protein n=1 Tax=Ectobacillus panaciterrae TaxID=363872 RepID=UPI000417EEEF|nr:DUF4176 domain-containing protein [Ectobacillus panaciterrae]